MKPVYILLDDPTCCGGVQQFVFDLHEFLDGYDPVVLPMFSSLAETRQFPGRMIRVNDPEKRNWLERWLSSPSERYQGAPWQITVGLLRDTFFLRRRLDELLGDGGNILIVNAMNILNLFLTPRVLQNNRIILPVHTAADTFLDWHPSLGGLFRARNRICKHDVDAMVCASPQDAAYLKRKLGGGRRIERVIRLTSPLPAEEELAVTRTRSVAVMARLVGIKRIDRVIATAQAASDFHFHIYGDGPERSALEQLAAGMSNITFHGYTADSAAAVASCAILMITSAHEGYCYSGIEALAHGKPLLVCNTYPAAADLVISGENGILLNDFTAQSAAESLRHMYAEYNHYHTGAMRSRIRYSRETGKQAWRTLLEEVNELEDRS